MEDTTIVRLTPGQEALAHQVIAQLKRPGSGAAAARAFLADERACLYAAWHAGTPVGFLLGYLLPRADVARPMGFLYEIEVAEGYRCQGIGRALVQAFLAEARARGCLKCFVLTNASNAPAVALYRSCGGVRRGTDEAMYEFPGAEGGALPVCPDQYPTISEDA